MKHILHAPFSNTFHSNTIHYAHLHLHICNHLSKKMPQNKLQKKHFAKKCKNKTCRDALLPKSTSPKTNETSDSAHHNACTDYPHIYRVATIPTSFQPHPPQSIPRPHTQPHTQYFPQQTTIQVSPSTMTPRLHPTTFVSLSTIIE